MIGKIIGYSILTVFGSMFLFTLLELTIRFLKKPIISRYTSLNNEGLPLLINYLVKKRNGEKIPIELTNQKMDELLEKSFAYVYERNDCSDFRIIMFITLIKDFENELPDNIKEKIKECLLSFKYWMDEPNEESLCIWSENHQLIYSTSEYIVGDMYPDEIFTNDGQKGIIHKKRAEKRIDIWMEHRFNYGFSEWNSSNYYPENISPMANFIHYTSDKERRNKMKIVMDMLWFDIASNSFVYKDKERKYHIFNGATARAYADNKINDILGNSCKKYIDITVQPEETKYLEDGWNDHLRSRFFCYRLMLEAKDENGKPYYQLPEIIKDIFNDNSEQVIKSSSSLNISELKKENLIGQSDRQIMYQFGMEAFSNPEVVNNTLKYVRKNKMFSNEFLYYFKYANLSVVRLFNLLPFLSKNLNLMPNGTALQRGNIYTYRNEYFSMSTAIKYCVGDFGAQQHIWGANINQYISLFTTNPARSKETNNYSPSYWIGNGRNPHSIQDKNVNISIYRLPDKKGIGENEIVKKTHAFCPLQYIDESCLDYLEKGYMFGRTGKVLFMMKTNGKLHYNDFEDSRMNDNSMKQKVDVENVFSESYDLINEENIKYHYWITQLEYLGDRYKSLQDFISVMINNNTEFSIENGQIKYDTDERKFEITYGQDYLLNGEKQQTEYQRYENCYVDNEKIERKQAQIIFQYNNKKLLLNFKNNIREEIK